MNYKRFSPFIFKKDNKVFILGGCYDTNMDDNNGNEYNEHFDLSMI